MISEYHTQEILRIIKSYDYESSKEIKIDLMFIYRESSRYFREINAIKKHKLMEDRHAKVLSLYKDGCLLGYIARLTNYRIETIKSVLRKFGVSFSSIPKEYYEERNIKIFNAYKNENKTYKQIGKEFNISSTRARAIAENQENKIKWERLKNDIEEENIR